MAGGSAWAVGRTRTQCPSRGKSPMGRCVTGYPRSTWWRQGKRSGTQTLWIGRDRVWALSRDQAVAPRPVLVMGAGRLRGLSSLGLARGVLLGWASWWKSFRRRWRGPPGLPPLSTRIQSLREVLGANNQALGVIARIQETLAGERPATSGEVRRLVAHLGRLTLAARQMDMLMDSDASPWYFAQAFLRGDLDGG